MLFGFSCLRFSHTPNVLLPKSLTKAKMKDQDQPPQHAEVQDQNGFQEVVGSFDANQDQSGLEAIEDPHHHQQTTDLIFCDEFPSLPDFPCMSSSSSTSSTPPQTKTISYASSSSSSSSSSTSSSCSTASWAVLRSDVEENKQQVSDQGDAPPPTALSSASSTEMLPFDQNIDDEMACMDIMMESIGGFMDLMEDNNDVWDTSSIFQQENYENKPLETYQLQGGGSEKVVDGATLERQQQPQNYQMGGNENEDLFFLQDGSSEEGQKNKEDLALVFFEWLKSNKESISAEDLRSIKIKTTTVEAAAKRLGGGKEGMKRLLKLILEWVQNNHLQRKRKREQLEASTDHQNHFLCYNNQYPSVAEPTLLNPSPTTLPPDPNSCFSPTAWNLSIPPPNLYAADPAIVGVPAPGPGFTSMLGYVGETFPNGAQNIVNGNVANYSPHSPPASGYQTHMLDSSQTWGQSQYGLASPYGFQDNNNLPQIVPYPPTFSSGAGGAAGYSQFPYQYVPGNGERLAPSGSSATKEARKKRMARQRRFLSHRHGHNHQNQQLQNQGQLEAEVMLGNENSNTIQANPNWVYWPSSTPAMPVVSTPSQTSPVIDRPVVHAQSYQRPILPERRPGWKPEKNLRFLLQKVLKQSDVGNLGRIVLPKKEAETHLPELEARDGINIPMEDIGTSRVWNMRYRFWPNNKSRMYLLENTGDFVKSNGLQEGDFIVLYSDVKCGKYMIRGVKVRQQGAKAEAKRPSKAQKKNSPLGASPGGNGATPASANKPIELTKASMEKGGETASNLDVVTHG